MSSPSQSFVSIATPDVGQAQAAPIPVRLEGRDAVAVERQAGSGAMAPQLAELGSEGRWRQLQELRRGPAPLDPWIEALASGALPVAADLLAALWSRLEPSAVSRLLASGAASQSAPWLQAGLQELPALAGRSEVRQAWLDPLLRRQAEAAAALGPDAPESLAWLQLLGQFREARVAQRLRQPLIAVTATRFHAGTPDLSTLPAGSTELLPLLGLQRDPRDAALLLRLALAPAPHALRRAALEGLALGLSSWPLAPLAAGLTTLAGDLDPSLAAAAVDLLARLPNQQAALRRLLRRPLDPAIHERLRRRIRPTPLVLLVHGGPGGVIPAALHDLARELASRRATPVLLQALTADQPEGDGRFWEAAKRASALSLVPLLLLPGGHVRHDLPPIAAAWRAQAALREGLTLRRLPFLGAWPGWQRALAEVLAHARRAASPGEGPDAAAIWLHHPLEGPLASRYLTTLAAVLAAPGQPASYSGPEEHWWGVHRGATVLLPLTLARSRLSEALNSAGGQPASDGPASRTLLPPLLEIPALRQHLLSALEALP